MKVVVSFNRRRTTLQAEGCQPFPFDEVVRGLSQVRAVDHRGCHHLSVGLRALGGLQRRFRVNLPSADGADRLSWDGHDLVRNPGETLGFRLEVEHQGGLSWQPEKVAAEHQELYRTAYLAPCPVMVDGRPLDNRPRLSRDTCYEPLGTGGAEDASEGFPVPSWSSQNAPRERVSHLWTLGLNFQVELPRLNPQARPKELPAPSRVLWVDDGVVVEEENFPFRHQGLSLELYISAKGLATDLSSLILRREQALNQRRERAIKDTVDRLEQLADQLQQAPPAISTLKNLRALARGLAVLPLSQPVIAAASVNRPLIEASGFQGRLRELAVTQLRSLLSALRRLTAT